MIGIKIIKQFNFLLLILQAVGLGLLQAVGLGLLQEKLLTSDKRMITQATMPLTATATAAVTTIALP